MTINNAHAFAEEHLEKIKVGILLFNSEKFWECHEDLEHHWLEARGDNVRLVYWAVIQAAACLYHVRDKNLVGAKGLLKKTLDKLEKCELNYVESALLEESLSWTRFKKVLREINSDPTIDDFKNLYNFKFKTPTEWSNE
jgi:uncharacterized protein